MQDLEDGSANGKEAIPEDLRDRIDFMAHDFLTEQPVKGAEAYLFRWILHNWSDLYCLQILRNLIPALKPGAYIVVNDNVLPEPGAMGAWQEDRLR